MKSKKITVAGMLVQEIVYSRPAGREAAAVRQAKRKVSTEAQMRMNAKYSWQKLELMLAANFLPRDLIVTLTFDEEHLPETRQQVNARLKKFRAELGKIRQRHRKDLRMIWTIEHRSGEGRWHVHAVINATGDDFSEILSCWPYGHDIEIRRLELNRQKNYESQAKYMCKEAREHAGLRSWSYTRSCRHPETESFPVPDDTDVSAPKEATVLTDASMRTEFGEFHFIKYLAASPQEIRKRGVRAKRKR